jgi:glyceraldehyde 3-phosphate dehydrogenase
MALRVAVNGFGRIGRNFLRAFYETPASERVDLEIVAINDLGSLESLAHLLQFDTTHGKFSQEVKLLDTEKQYGLQLENSFIAVSHEESPQECPWQKHNIDLVIEATGKFRARDDAALHLNAGAKKVLIAAVAFDEVDATVVVDVNDDELNGSEKIVSAASCTTHCIAPVLAKLEEQFGIDSVFMTEMHAYTSDQCILDHVHRDLRRARAGAQNMIPTSSSSIAAVQEVLPALKNRIKGYSMRVPINNVAAVDLCVTLKQNPGPEKINDFFNSLQNNNSIGFTDLPLVSSDFVHRKESAIIDASQTQSIGQSIKLLAWYDNEWGYVNRLLDLIERISSKVVVSR